MLLYNILVAHWYLRGYNCCLICRRSGHDVVRYLNSPVQIAVGWISTKRWQTNKWQTVSLLAQSRMACAGWKSELLKLVRYSAINVALYRTWNDSTDIDCTHLKFGTSICAAYMACLRKDQLVFVDYISEKTPLFRLFFNHFSYLLQGTEIPKSNQT